MFWIFRRTKLSQAAGFFSSLNNNNNNNNRSGNGSSGSTSSNQNTSLSGVNNNKKGYNKLSGEEADYINCNNNNNNNDSIEHTMWNCSRQHKADDHGSDSDSSCSDFDLHEEEDFSDDTDFDEALTCNVCDRSFVTPRQLAHHQQKKRHFGCSACDSLFPSLMALEHHKEEFDHWSGDELSVGNQSGDEDSIETVCSEELERLL